MTEHSNFRSSGTAPALTSQDVRWGGPGVLIVRFRGRVSGAQTMQLLETVREELAAEPVRAFVFDCTRAESYTVDVRAPGVELLQALRDAGATRGYAAASSSSIRMIGTAVAFVAGVNVRFVESVSEAVRLASTSS